MASKPLPKPVSERTLQKKYKELAELTHARIDVATEPGRRLSALLHRYFLSFSSLYGLLALQTAWELFREIEPELVRQKKILKKDFFAFSDILRAEALPYYILNWEEVFPDEPDVDPHERLLANKALVGYGYYRFYDLYVLLDSQDNKPLALLKKEEYLAWAEPDHFRKSFCARAMLRFLEDLRVSGGSPNRDVEGRPIKGKALNSFIFWNKDECSTFDLATRKWEKDAVAAKNNIIESEKLMRKIERHIQLGDRNISMAEFLHWTVEDLEEVGVRLNQSKFERLIQLYTDLNNQSRLWCNCGWSPNALAQMASPQTPPSISFGPGLQAAFANGDMDPAELERMLREKGFTVSGGI